jgi:hypothetical protein
MFVNVCAELPEFCDCCGERDVWEVTWEPAP